MRVCLPPPHTPAALPALTLGCWSSLQHLIESTATVATAGSYDVGQVFRCKRWPCSAVLQPLAAQIIAHHGRSFTPAAGALSGVGAGPEGRAAAQVSVSETLLWRTVALLRRLDLGRLQGGAAATGDTRSASTDVPIQARPPHAAPLPPPPPPLFRLAGAPGGGEGAGCSSRH